MGRIGCLSLLLTNTVFHGVPLEPSCAVASQIASFVRSLLSLKTLVGCKYALMSSSHLVAGLHCFRYPFCLVDIAGFQLEMNVAWRSSWRLATILACCPYNLCCLRIHEVVPFAANKSSVLWLARILWSIHGSTSSSGSSHGDALAMARLLSMSRLLSSCPLRWKWLCSIVSSSGSLSGSWCSPSAISSTFGACAVARHFLGFSVRLYDPPHHRSLCCPECFLQLFRHRPRT